MKVSSEALNPVIQPVADDVTVHFLSVTGAPFPSLLDGLGECMAFTPAPLPH